MVRRCFPESEYGKDCGVRAFYRSLQISLLTYGNSSSPVWVDIIFCFYLMLFSKLLHFGAALGSTGLSELPAHISPCPSNLENRYRCVIIHRMS